MATTADVVKVLEGGPQTKASWKMKRNCVQSVFFTYCLLAIGSVWILRLIYQ